jgi:hypothetical protein
MVSLPATPGARSLKFCLVQIAFQAGPSGRPTIYARASIACVDAVWNLCAVGISNSYITGATFATDQEGVAKTPPPIFVIPLRLTITPSCCAQGDRR